MLLYPLLAFKRSLADLYCARLYNNVLIRSPRYFEGRTNALGFILPLYASPVISKPRYFELFTISLGLRNSGVRLYRVFLRIVGLTILRGKELLQLHMSP